MTADGGTDVAAPAPGEAVGGGSAPGEIAPGEIAKNGPAQAEVAPKRARPAMMRVFELVERVKAYDPDADEDLINRAYVTRYGIEIGQVTIAFNKK